MPAWVRALAAAAVLLSSGPAARAETDTSDLVSDTQFRVCADPANMPFSNSAGEGFENAIAALLAAKLGRELTYTWFPQATGFVRQTLMLGKCDVIIGFAQGDELVLNTNHYYVSAYVLVTRADSDIAAVDRLSDPALAGRRIGVVAGSPPASHLVRNGLIGTSRPYPLMVDRRFESPAERMIEDLAAGEIDAAILWGPIAGHFARRTPEALRLTPLLREEGAPRLFYRITMGVRQGEQSWKRALNSVLRRHRAEIDAILTDFGVPLVDEFGRSEGAQ